MSTTKTYPTLSINAIAFQVSSGRGYEGHIKGCTESVIISVHEDHLMQNSISASPLPQDTVMAIFTPHAKMPNYPECLASFNMENISNATNSLALRQQINLLQNINTGVGYASEAAKYGLRNYGNYSFALHRTGARVYPNGWGGNGKIKVYKIKIETNRSLQKVASKIAKGTFLIGAAFDIGSAVLKEQSWQKTAMNIGMSALAFLGPWGWIAAGIYTVLDLSGAFDPVGKGKISEDENKRMNKPIKQDNTRNTQLENTKFRQQVEYKKIEVEKVDIPQTIIKQQPK